jgi:hypothetical protein
MAHAPLDSADPDGAQHVVAQGESVQDNPAETGIRAVADSAELDDAEQSRVRPIAHGARPAAPEAERGLGARVSGLGQTSQAELPQEGEARRTERLMKVTADQGQASAV